VAGRPGAPQLRARGPAGRGGGCRRWMAVRRGQCALPAGGRGDAGRAPCRDAGGRWVGRPARWRDRGDHRHAGRNVARRGQGEAGGAGREGGRQRVEEDRVPGGRRRGRVEACEGGRTRHRGLGRGAAAGLPGRAAVSHDALRLRARLNRVVRDFFDARGVLEVETPVMSRAGNTEPNIASFTVALGGRTEGAPPTRWLRTSAEFPMKRLLAEGIGDCYELGRVFRDGEAGGRHNPEFTMLEWYRVGWALEPLIDETAALVQAALALVARSATVRRASCREGYREALGLDPRTAPLAQLRAAAP